MRSAVFGTPSLPFITPHAPATVLYATRSASVITKRLLPAPNSRTISSSRVVSCSNGLSKRRFNTISRSRYRRLSPRCGSRQAVHRDRRPCRCSPWAGLESTRHIERLRRHAEKQNTRPGIFAQDAAEEFEAAAMAKVYVEQDTIRPPRSKDCQGLATGRSVANG